MVAIDAERIDESGVRIQSAPTAPQVPRWLQGIATINRLRSVDTPESINPEAVLAALQQLCSHGKIAERVSAARVLPKISRQCDPEVIDFLLGDTISSASCGMRDIASEVRAAAATAVGELASNTGNARVISGLIALFEDSDWTVRSSALTALSSVAALSCDDNCLKELLNCLAGRMWYSRVLAAQALGNVAPRGSRAAVRGLAMALAVFDEDWAVQKAAAASMGLVAEVGDRSALDALIPLLQDADWRVRKTALVSIGNVAERGCSRAIQAILLRLDDTSVAAPQRFDVGWRRPNGVLDVKLTAVSVLQQVAAPRDPQVLEALRDFQERLVLPQDERLSGCNLYNRSLDEDEQLLLAMRLATHAIASMSEHEGGGGTERCSASSFTPTSSSCASPLPAPAEEDVEDTGESLELGACSSDDSDSEGSLVGGELEPPTPAAAAAPAPAAPAPAPAPAAAVHAEGGHALLATDVSGPPNLIH